MYRIVGWLLLLPLFGAFWLAITVASACGKKGGFWRIVGALSSISIGAVCCLFGYGWAFQGLTQFKGDESYQTTYPIWGWISMIGGCVIAILGVWTAVATLKEKDEANFINIMKYGRQLYPEESCSTRNLNEIEILEAMCQLPEMFSINSQALSSGRITKAESLIISMKWNKGKSAFCIRDYADRQVIQSILHDPRLLIQFPDMAFLEIASHQSIDVDTIRDILKRVFAEVYDEWFSYAAQQMREQRTRTDNKIRQLRDSIRNAN